MKIQSLGLPVIATAFLLSACESPYTLGKGSSADGDGRGGVNSAVPTPTPDPNKVICNPLDPTEQADARLGIKASLYYIENFEPNGPFPVTSNEEFVTKGVKVDAEMYLSDFKVTPRSWSNGFMATSGKYVSRPNGDKLFEWFSIQGESQFQLESTDSDGFYQLGALTDDGVYVEVQKSDGSWERLLDHQYPHNPQFSCATKTIGLAKGKKIHMRMAYYQGPRYYIAAMLMWRKVADPDNIPSEPECFVHRDDNYFYNTNYSPPTKADGFTGLESRGWAVIKPGNFLLAEGTNKCVK